MEAFDFKELVEKMKRGEIVLPETRIPTQQELEDERRTDFERHIAFWQKDYSLFLPADWNLRSLDALQDSTEKALLSSYMPAHDDFGFLLMGKSGAGKTFILNAIMNKVLNACFEYRWPMENVVYFPIGYLIYQFRVKKDSKEFDKCLKSAFLFLDDLGAENTTDFAREHFFTILDIRCQRRLPTFISTNLLLNELTLKYGERVVSRLKEMCAILEIKGSDKRTDILRDRVSELKNRINN